MSLKYVLAERSWAQITAPKCLEKQASQASLLAASFSLVSRRTRRYQLNVLGSGGVKTGLAERPIKGRASSYISMRTEVEREGAGERWWVEMVGSLGSV